MTIREAVIEDIPALQVIRHAVKENVLSDPSVVTDADCIAYLTQRGKGWVSLSGDMITGFAIADLEDHNIWALFVHPGHEHKGIGKLLHDTMMDWYFSQTNITAWLSTDAHTRAEQFYRKAGWKETGKYGKTEIKFEMDAATWLGKQV
ncbi:GNAT family N-acetyltransferase [Terrimonas rubra]|uniref:GNAT family N-acetyltransferase n=1 Tax=Terrimonas rubra TaxID=1035890 RepID=A0ABW6AA68_9BACT